MFWGLIMEPNKRYKQLVKKSFHISMASLDYETAGNGPAQIMCTYEGRTYLLCTLKHPDMLQCTLDLEFTTGNEVAFATNGKGLVHLTGYLSDLNNEDDLTLEDLEEEEEVVIEAESKEKRKNKKKKSDQNAERPAKKAKLQNGSPSEEASDEESDDPDFEEADNEELSEEEEEEAENASEIGEEEEESGNDEEDEEGIEEEETKLTQSKAKETVKPKQANGDQKKQTNIEKNQKKPKQTLKGGVIVEDLVEGNGPPAKVGRFVTVYYEGRLQKNNKMFDSTLKGPGFKFQLGAGEVIKGWDIGLVGMKVGGKRKIICPPQAAYGVKGSPPAIPPNSTLVFTVTLNKVK